MEIELGLTISALVAGLLMFLAPCTLPLVPAFIAFISGVRERDIESATGSRLRLKVMSNSLAFVVGFSVVFISFGILAGLFGTVIGPLRGILTQVGGALIIVFGLFMLGVFNFSWLKREYKFQFPSWIEPGHPSSAFIVGSTFALGWTPCVGPVLASVLLLASTSTTVLSGAWLLGVFSLGLAIPFLLTALLYTQAQGLIAHSASLLRFVSVVGGIFLLGIGVLLLTDNFNLTIEYGYKLFSFFGFEALYDYF
ncbi:cytochrome c biogenesis protein CcdA [Candidatus Pacebacteria bacterium]|nr:cytochrome c biogenesis protein CcdA [Candidatus Paceibacterota bacterium]